MTYIDFSGANINTPAAAAAGLKAHIINKEIEFFKITVAQPHITHLKRICAACHPGKIFIQAPIPYPHPLRVFLRAGLIRQQKTVAGIAHKYTASALHAGAHLLIPDF